MRLTLKKKIKKKFKKKNGKEKKKQSIKQKVKRRNEKQKLDNDSKSHHQLLKENQTFPDFSYVGLSICQSTTLQHKEEEKQIATTVVDLQEKKIKQTETEGALSFG